MLTSPGAHAILMPTSRGPHLILVLTSPGPHVTIAWQATLATAVATLPGLSGVALTLKLDTIKDLLGDLDGILDTWAGYAAPSCGPDLRIDLLTD